MEWLKQIKDQRPLVECITNNVTVNDVANCILAVGASPVMAVEKSELREIIAISSGVLLNIGTMSMEQAGAFEDAATYANEMGKALVLDPVGAGATSFRTNFVRSLLERHRFALIRGNASELAAIAGHMDGGGDCGTSAQTTAGVDAAASDAITDETLPRWTKVAAAVAQRHRCVVAISGAIDVICDGARTWLCRNGVPQMPLVTGTGCSLTGICAAFQAVAAEEERGEAAAVASALMGCAGELAWRRSGALGLGSFRQSIVDSLSTMDDTRLAAMQRLEEA